ncbi:unnamed protein product [marine sediment metagenome]|uniref:Uncharacterized protein n=1 Tax=marine sediment metagenome TaxID=412755 RepID=X0TH59_9ZZZZ
MPRLSELQYGISTEGPKVKLEQIEGALVTVLAVGFFKSDFAPGAAIQFSQDDVKSWLVTYSQVVIETLEKYMDKLPLDAMFIQQTSAIGRKFWTIE